MANITFFLEKRKDKSGKVRTKNVPIHMYFTFNAHRLLFYTGERIDADKWDPKKGQVKAGVTGRAEINLLLQSQAEFLLKTYREALITNATVTPEYIKSKFNEYKCHSLPKEDKGMMHLMDEWIEIKKRTISHGYYKHLLVLRNHIRGFVKGTGARANFNDIDLAWMESLQGYLVGQGDTHNTVSNIIQKFKTFLNHTAKNGHNKNVRYKDYKISWKKGEVIYLTWEELLAFYQKPMPSVTLEQVRDLFSFACFSGMRYGDLRNLTKDSVHEGYIRYNMAKTRQQLNHTIPLNDYSKEILAKYKDYPGKRALPVISNQKMNDYLKDVGKIAGLDYPITVVRIRGSERIVITKPKYEWLTSHVGRKTFITNALQKGIIAEVVMGISGHADTKSFKHYFTISEEHKSREMNRHFSKDPSSER